MIQIWPPLYNIWQIPPRNVKCSIFKIIYENLILSLLLNLKIPMTYLKFCCSIDLLKIVCFCYRQMLKSDVPRTRCFLYRSNLHESWLPFHGQLCNSKYCHNLFEYYICVLWFHYQQTKKNYSSMHNGDYLNYDLPMLFIKIWSANTRSRICSRTNY